MAKTINQLERELRDAREEIKELYEIRDRQRTEADALRKELERSGRLLDVVRETMIGDHRELTARAGRIELRLRGLGVKVTQ